jgi:hypothetical protein
MQSPEYRPATEAEKHLLVPYLLWKSYKDWHNPPEKELKRVTARIEQSRIEVYDGDRPTMAVYWNGESQPELFFLEGGFARSNNYHPDQLDYIYDP